MKIKQIPASRPKVKPWKFAGLILTYWCSSRCANCYLSCRPDREVDFMSVADALNYWQSLEAMAGTGAKVHLTGGEPFGNWPALLSILRAARAKGLTAHELETNAFWCTEQEQVYQRCQQLKELSIGRLVVSCDVYHQQHIPFERVELLVQVAQEVLGANKIRIRWRDFFANPLDISKLNEADCQRAYREAWQKHHDRLTGRAAKLIAPLLGLQAAETFVGQDCQKAILASRGVHIDPAGNVFPGVCAGLVVGNASKKELAQIWDNLVHTEDEILLSLIRSGPYGLLPIAKGLGYKGNQMGFANKCHMCTEIRSFLWQSGKFEPTIGPVKCYHEN